jgi:hypothetical protein
MYFLAAAVTKGSGGLRDVTPEFWMKIGLAVLGLIVVIVVLRKLAKVNKVVLAIGTLLVLSIVGFNWIYERNEPEWATPVVKWLANYFPTKDAIQTGPGHGKK